MTFCCQCCLGDISSSEVAYPSNTTVGLIFKDDTRMSGVRKWTVISLAYNNRQ